MNAAPITRDEMTAWSRYVQDACGIYLDATKGYLIETRLSALLRETGALSYTDLLNRVRMEPGKVLRTKIINAITTNETSFFRDSAPFELLQFKVFPELIDRRTRAGLRPVPLRILSAACSTGQEIYSTAILLKEMLGDLKGYDIRMLGLDISDAAVAAASYAHFSRMELDRGMSAERLTRHFVPSGDKWKLRDELRALVTFQRANLLEPLPGGIVFDLIFCRNVAIYFTEADKVRLFRNLGRSLARDGALLIGSTESLTGLCPEFEPKRYQRSIYYSKKEA